MGKLSDYLDNDLGNLDTESYFPPLMYPETKQAYSGNPRKVTFADGIHYYDANGVELVPLRENEVDPQQMEKAEALTFLREPYRTAQEPSAQPIRWAGYTLDLEEVKEYLKLETNAEDRTLHTLAAAAVEKAQQMTNRNYLDVPRSVHLAILKTIAYWYENRSDLDNLPADAEKIFFSHRRNPGL